MTTTTTTSTTTSTTTTTTTILAQLDPCYMVKDIIDGVSITKDDNSTSASIFVVWGPLEDRELSDMFDTYDAIIVVCASGRPLRSQRRIQNKPVEYVYQVPVTVLSKDKTGITGEYTQWKIETGIRDLLEDNAAKSGRYAAMDDGRDISLNVAGAVIHTMVYTVEYETKGD